MREAMDGDAQIAVDGCARTEHGQCAARSLPDGLRLLIPLVVALGVVGLRWVGYKATDKTTRRHLSQEHQLGLDDLHARAREEDVERAGGRYGTSRPEVAGRDLKALRSVSRATGYSVQGTGSHSISGPVGEQSNGGGEIPRRGFMEARDREPAAHGV